MQPNEVHPPFELAPVAPAETIASHADTNLSAADQALAAALTIRVSDQASYSLAAKITTSLNAMYDAIEGERKGIVAPLTLSIQRINGLFKRPKERLESAVAHLKAEIAGYHQRANEVRAAQASAGLHVELAPPAAEGVQIREVWTFTVEDADKVPRGFCSPDNAKIREHMSNGGVLSIPGVKFFQSQQVRTSRKVGP